MKNFSIFGILTLALFYVGSVLAHDGVTRCKLIGNFSEHRGDRITRSYRESICDPHNSGSLFFKPNAPGRCKWASFEVGGSIVEEVGAYIIETHFNYTGEGESFNQPLLKARLTGLQRTASAEFKIGRIIDRENRRKYTTLDRLNLNCEIGAVSFLKKSLIEKNLASFRESLRTFPPDSYSPGEFKTPREQISDIAGYAIGLDEVEFLRAILDFGHRDSFGEDSFGESTPLVAAVRAGSKKALKFLAAKFPEYLNPINSDFDFGTKSALHAAISKKDIESALILLDAGANPNLFVWKVGSSGPNLYGLSPFCFAYVRGFGPEFSKLLIERGANPNLRCEFRAYPKLDGSYGTHPLDFAMNWDKRGPDIETIKQLILHGADINTPMSGPWPTVVGESALASGLDLSFDYAKSVDAAELARLREEMVVFLLKHRANPNPIAVEYPVAPLYQIVRSDLYLGIAERLLKAGANPKIKSWPYNRTPCENDATPQMLALIQRYGGCN